MTTAPTPPELAIQEELPVDDHEHHDFRMFGLLTFLVSESLMFGALFAVFLIFRGEFPQWPPEETEVELILPAINTVILVSSSFVIHYGDVAIKKGNVAGLRKWYWVTALMGAIFLGGQAYEYATLGYGLTTNVFANCFYIMTGFHGLHVFVGILLILCGRWKLCDGAGATTTNHCCGTTQHGKCNVLDLGKHIYQSYLIYKQKFSRAKYGGCAPATPIPFSLLPSVNSWK